MHSCRTSRVPFNCLISNYANLEEAYPLPLSVALRATHLPTISCIRVGGVFMHVTLNQKSVALGSRHGTVKPRTGNRRGNSLGDAMLKFLFHVIILLFDAVARSPQTRMCVKIS